MVRRVNLLKKVLISILLFGFLFTVGCGSDKMSSQSTSNVETKNLNPQEKPKNIQSEITNSKGSEESSMKKEPSQKKIDPAKAIVGNWVYDTSESGMDSTLTYTNGGKFYTSYHGNKSKLRTDLK